MAQNALAGGSLEQTIYFSPPSVLHTGVN
jgi:hypothetical protein